MATRLLFQHIVILLEELAILMATKVLFNIVIFLEELAILKATNVFSSTYSHFT